MAKSRGEFTEILVKRQTISSDQLFEAETLAQQTGAKIQDALIKLNYATIDEIMSAIAEHSGMQSVNLKDVTIPPSVIEMVPESVARENVVIPLAMESGTLRIVISDPCDSETLQKLQFILNVNIQPVLALREQIVEAINRHYGQTETESVDSMLQEFTDTQIDFTETEKTENMAAAEDSDSPVVKLVNLIVQEAISLRASDIHIEPFADRVRIRYRIDGVLVERDSPPRRLLAPMISRLKIMGSIDIAEKRRPQDGRIKMTSHGKHFDLRVSMLPTNHGQSCVMRILDRNSIQVNIRDLGFSEEDYKRFLQIIKRPNGIFLVTGPTGSGKTTTLYSALNELNRPDRKIITAEDPVEYYLPGINQVEVKHSVPRPAQLTLRNSCIGAGIPDARSQSMRFYRAARAIVIAATLAGSVTGCAVRARAYDEGYYAYQEPPPPRYVQTGYRPGWVFIQGHWFLGDDNQWAWREGYWERQRPAAFYVQGRWISDGNRWRWMPGHWREGGRYGGQGTTYDRRYYDGR